MSDLIGWDNLPLVLEDCRGVGSDLRLSDGLGTGLCVSSSFPGPSFFRNVPESAPDGGQPYRVKFQVIQVFIFGPVLHPLIHFFHIC